MKTKPMSCHPWDQSSLAQAQAPSLISCGQTFSACLGTSPRDIIQKDSLGLPSEVGTSKIAPSKLKTENLSPLWEVLLLLPRLSAGRAKALPSHDIVTHPAGSCHRKSKDDDFFFFLATYLLPCIILGQLPQGLSPTLVSPTQTYYNSKKKKKQKTHICSKPSWSN